MSATRNELRIDITRNADLRAFASTKQIGDEVTFEITFTVASKDSENFGGPIKSIEYDDETADEGEGEVTPSPNEPLMVRAIKAGSAKPSESEEMEAEI